MKRFFRRRAGLIAVAALVLLAVIYWAGHSAGEDETGPAAIAVLYLEARERGDAEAACELVDEEIKRQLRGECLEELPGGSGLGLSPEQITDAASGVSYQGNLALVGFDKPLDTTVFVRRDSSSSPWRVSLPDQLMRPSAVESLRKAHRALLAEASARGSFADLERSVQILSSSAPELSVETQADHDGSLNTVVIHSDSSPRQIHLSFNDGRALYELRGSIDGSDPRITEQPLNRRGKPNGPASELP